ncbi:MAG TPA: dienelactone hydrolase family protein [Acidimicrobiales bacterium]|nr:dienelactone hydrolase family protein [Acidimicrobiales bacterium]
MEREALIPTDGLQLRGDLAVPPWASGVVVFAHGSGSGRHSPRNRRVAGRLQDAELATLLLDLLTEDEERVDARTGELRFDIGLLAGRLQGAASWLEEQDVVAGLPVGYFGASTGAAAALVAAAERPVAAVVSRGGRPDLAGRAPDSVEAPTLLLVGSLDEDVLELNREALTRLRGVKELRVVEGAGHLFEEPGKLEEVADLAAEWFGTHLRGP